MRGYANFKMVDKKNRRRPKRGWQWSLGEDRGSHLLGFSCGYPLF
jgi:hypothetical protein